jgi:iron-sulfur cluster assembly accessory protein
MMITEKAAEKVKEILTGEGKGSWGIKVYIAGESCCGPQYGLNLQEAQMPDDEIIEKNGIRVFIDKQVLPTLAGRELDYYVGDEGEGFMFNGGSSCSPDGGACGSGGGACGSGGGGGCGSRG